MVPVVGSGNLGSQKHRRAANSLLDDPAAVGHARNELQHGVPLLIGCWVIKTSFHKSAQPSQVAGGHLSHMI